MANNIARVIITKSYLIQRGRYTEKTNPVREHKKVRGILNLPATFDAEWFYTDKPAENDAMMVAVASDKNVFHPQDLNAEILFQYPVDDAYPDANDLQILRDAGYPVMVGDVPAITIDMFPPQHWTSTLNAGQRNKLQSILDAFSIGADISLAPTFGDAVNIVVQSWGYPGLSVGGFYDPNMFTTNGIA